jgi:hypothetical protein
MALPTAQKVALPSALTIVESLPLDALRRHWPGSRGAKSGDAPSSCRNAARPTRRMPQTVATCPERPPRWDFLGRNIAVVDTHERPKGEGTRSEETNRDAKGVSTAAGSFVSRSPPRRMIA